MSQTLFACVICQKDVKEKRSLLNHLRLHIKRNEYRIKADEEILRLEGLREKEHICDVCGKKFLNNYNLKRHETRSCRGRRQLNLSLAFNSEQISSAILNESDLDVLLNYQKLISDRLQTLQNAQNAQSIPLKSHKTQINNQVNTQVHNVNNPTMTNNSISIGNIQNVRNANININTINKTINNYNINVLNLGDENTEFLYQNSIDWKELIEEISKESRTHDEDIRRINDVLFKMYQEIHCNKDHPENHNIFITNIKSSVPFHIYRNNAWTRGGTMEILHDIVFLNKERFLEMIDTLSKDDPTCDHKLLLRIKKKVIRRFETYEDRIKKQLGKKYFLATYNNKDIIAKTYQGTVKPDTTTSETTTIPIGADLHDLQEIYEKLESNHSKKMITN